MSFKDVQISDEAIQSTPTEHSTESIQTSPTIPEPIQTLSTIPITNSDVIQDSIVSTTVDETQAPSIETFPTAFFNFQNVSPAGISASQSYKEKRHYSVKKDQIQLQLDDLENDMKVGNEKLSSYSDGFLSSVRKSSNRKDPTFKMAKWILEHVKAKK